MTTYIRPAAVARDDADMVAGWNISPNTGYQLQISATSSGAEVILLSVDGSTLIGSGVAAVGASQPVTITPMAGQTVGMADASMGWHMLLTTDGTEGDRTITMDAMVDLSARTHPVYVDDDLALAVAAADINAGTHYTQDVVASCPLGFGASVGDTASVPVDGSAVVGQVESVTWAGTPDGSTAQAVIRAHIPIRPDAYTPPVVPTPPTVVDDTGTTDAATATGGNVLANDSGTLTVSAVNGISSNVGVTVSGSIGGDFVINADGSWTFDPAGDFSTLTGSDTATTSVTYHASNGIAEAMATLTVTVSRANTAPVAVNDTGETDAATTTSGNALTTYADADGDTLTVSRVKGSAGNVGQAVAGSNGGVFTIASTGAWTFDPDGDFESLTGEQAATTSVTYHVSDGIAEDEGMVTVTVSGIATVSDPYIANVVMLLNAYGAQGSTTIQPQIGSTLTRGGDTKIDLSQGNPSILFDTSGDYLHTGAVSSLITTQDFCIEAIVTPITRSADSWGRAIYSQYYYVYESVNRTLFSIYDNGTLKFQRGDFVLSSTQTLPLNLRAHVAVTRYGSVLRLWIDGIVVAESSVFSGKLSPVLSCISGLYYAGYKASFAGHIHALRVTRGVPRYAVPFDPPTYPFPTA